MKKLFAFLVVAVLAGAAEGAAINLLVNDVPWTGEDVKPSDVITVTWVNDEGPGIWGGFGEFTINVSNGDQAGDAWTCLPFAIPSITPKDGGFDVFITGAGMPMPEGDVAGWTFHVPDYKLESDYIIIDPVSGTWFSRVATVGPEDSLPYVVLHVVPEPVSFFVLGLGAVLLYRRGRKR